MAPVNRGVRVCQELLVVREVPLLLSLRSGWWRSHRQGRPLVLEDQVDPSVPAVRGFLLLLGDPCHPLCRCILALLSAPEVRPARADLEVLAFLESLAVQTGLLFLSDHPVP